MNRFEGDPKIIIDADGADLVFKGGQPVMDRGLENAALIGLFTQDGWAGNYLISDNDQKVGSPFEKTARGPITLTSLNDVKQAGEKALSGLGDVSLSVSNPNSNQMRIVALIKPQGADALELLVSKNGINWMSQAKEPAYNRI